MREVADKHEQNKPQTVTEPEANGEIGSPLSTGYTRREALVALAKYSASVGGSAGAIVTAEGLVSEASAYPEGFGPFCQQNPWSSICDFDTFEDWLAWLFGIDRRRSGGSGGNTSGRIKF